MSKTVFISDNKKYMSDVQKSAFIDMYELMNDYGLGIPSEREKKLYQSLTGGVNCG